jgi:lipoprotein-releasing system permease protein
VRGIRSYREKLALIETLPGLRIAPVLIGPVVLSFAGRDQAGSLSGIIPSKMKTVSTIQEKIQEGSLDALTANPNGIIIGRGLADKFQIGLGRNLSVATQDGGSRVMKVVGIFRTGNAIYDESQSFANLKRAQVMFDRPNRINRFIIQLDDAYQARDIAHRIESAIAYKATSWTEASEDILSLLTVRNIIMFSVVLAILIVASFGIYNTLSTIVIEKTRDIAILKSMGFHANDIRLIFLFEGSIIGAIGSVFGLLLGAGLMHILSTIEVKPPGVTEKAFLPIWWGIEQFELAVLFALSSCILAAYLPARRAGKVHPVEILRGA